MNRAWKWSLLVLVPCVIWGFCRLRLETDILATLPPEVTEVRALKLLRDGFAGGSDLVLALQAEDEEVATAVSEKIATQLQNKAALVKEVRWAQPLEQQAQTGASLLAWSLRNAPPEKLQAIRTQLESDAGLSTRLQRSLGTLTHSMDASRAQMAAYDPLGLLEALDTSAMSALEGSLFGLVSEDGSFRLLLITPATAVGNYKAAGAWLKEIQEQIQACLSPTERQQVRLRYTGEPAFQSEIGMGIEKDMSSTIGLTEVFIALLFWIMFRRLKPLLWIQGLVALSMVLTLGLGGLLVGKISLMSLGFAAIVLGIIVDYAVLIIQEARQEPQLDSAALRRQAAPGIIAGACTTAIVFLSLLVSGLPGLAELGLLVALGVLVGLGVMLGFAPMLAAGRQAVTQPSAAESQVERGRAGGFFAHPGWALVATLVCWFGSAAVLVKNGLPAFQSGAEALRPTQSEAMDTFQWVQERLGREHEASVPLLISGPADHLRQQAQQLIQVLEKEKAKGHLVRHAVPTLLLPDAAAQKANESFCHWLISQQPRFVDALSQAGFSDKAHLLLNSLNDVWRIQQAAVEDESTAQAAPVLMRALASGERALKAGLPPGHAVALGSISVPGRPGLPDRAALTALQSALPPDSGAWLAGWETLGSALSQVVRADLRQQLLPILALITVTLLITFRSLRDVLLSAALLGTGMALLAAIMSLTQQSWNLASLAAIPLLLGTGMDYGIHILMALKRTGNAVAQVQGSTGRAVFFSGMTTVIGFSSLFCAGNRGISSLGAACCLGTLCILALVLWLLPHWRRWLHRG
jgi:uncharacterized protein